jgi:pyrimidine operon attenuation protein/uracil phosphoribosyltransferase
MSTEKKYVLSKEAAEKKLRRMALEIIENNLDEKEIILAGIRENGNVLAENIRDYLAEGSSLKTQLMSLTLDKKEPREVLISKTLDFNDKVIVIIDDVSNSGRTLLYAVKPFLEFQPKKIQTLVLVERRHNHFPVRPDYVGLSIATTLQEHIYVEVRDDKVMGAYLR